MRNATLIPVALIATLLGAACEPAPQTGDVPDSYREVLPDERIQVSMNTDIAGARDVGDLAESYLFTAEVTDNVNGMIGGVLSTVEMITDYEPTWVAEEENTAIWGPWSDSLDASEGALWVHHDTETDIYTWGIAARERGNEDWDAFETFVVGQVNEGATEDDSDGWFYMDFDIMAAHDPTSDAAGRFASGYDIDPDGTVEATAAFEAFVGEDDDEPVDAFYAYGQDAGGNGSMDLIFVADMDDNGSAAETHAVRSRWLADGSGRADAAIGEGDMGELVGYQSECWDPAPDFGRSFYGNNWDLSQVEGDPANCVFTDEDFSDDEPSTD